MANIPPAWGRIAAALSRERGVTLEKGWGAGNLVLKAGGKIFAMLQGGDVVLKLPRARVDELVESGAGCRFDPRRDGRVMKEWIVMRASSVRPALAREALEFVRSGKG